LKILKYYAEDKAVGTDCYVNGQLTYLDQSFPDDGVPTVAVGTVLYLSRSDVRS
jgi:hypothetical protein